LHPLVLSSRPRLPCGPLPMHRNPLELGEHRPLDPGPGRFTVSTIRCSDKQLRTISPSKTTFSPRTTKTPMHLSANSFPWCICSYVSSRTRLAWTVFESGKHKCDDQRAPHRTDHTTVERRGASCHLGG
jgi:hypothetical protein